MKRSSENSNIKTTEEGISGNVVKKLKVDQNVNNSKPPGKQTVNSTFSLRKEPQLDLPFPFFREPNEIGHFSQNKDRKFCPDNSQLKYIVNYPKNKPVYFNLRHGYKDMIKRDDNVLEYLDDLLRWIMTKPGAFRVQSSGNSTGDESKLDSLNTDFICWRGLLTKFLCTPYENREGWKVAIIYFRKTYFLCEFNTEDKKIQLSKVTDRQDEMCYWGWKFEQYVSSDTKDGKPDAERPVNNNQGYCSVVRSRLTQNSLVYGAEIDAIDESIPLKNKYVEFKTTRQVDNGRQDQNFKRFKLIKWWAQSFLIGISKIISGVRDDHGHVHTLEEFETTKIPDLVKDIPNSWKANVCFNFMDQLLNFIKDSIKEENERCVYILEYIPGKHITLQEIGDDPEYKFLPDWFINWNMWSS